MGDVRSRTRPLKRNTAFGPLRRFGVCPIVKLNPKNLRSHGSPTALLCSLTLSLSFVVVNRVKLFITRSPARRLPTYMLLSP